MTKREIFDKVIETTSDVCNVPITDIMERRRTDDAVIARTIALFWLTAANMSTREIMKFTNTNNHQSIDAMRAAIEPNWKMWDYHILVEEVGRRLADYGVTQGIMFDYWRPIRRIQNATGFVYYSERQMSGN